MALIRRDFKTLSIFALKMIGIWFIAYSIFVFFRNFGIDESIRFEMVDHVDHLTEFGTITLISILTGLFYTALEVFFDRQYFQKIPFGKVILIKSILYFFMMRIVFFFGALFFAWMGGLPINAESMMTAMMSKTFWTLLLYFLLISAFISFVLQVSQKFGPGMLWNLWSEIPPAHRRRNAFFYLSICMPPQLMQNNWAMSNSAAYYKIVFSI